MSRLGEFIWKAGRLMIGQPKFWVFVVVRRAGPADYRIIGRAYESRDEAIEVFSEMTSLIDVEISSVYALADATVVGETGVVTLAASGRLWNAYQKTGNGTMADSHSDLILILDTIWMRKRENVFLVDKLDLSTIRRFRDNPFSNN